MAKLSAPHSCDITCTTATTHRDQCECECRGANHGRYEAIRAEHRASGLSRMDRLGGGNPFHGLPTSSDDLFGAA